MHVNTFQTINGVLQKELYADYVQAPSWPAYVNTLIAAKAPPIIVLQTTSTSEVKSAHDSRVHGEVKVMSC